MADFLFGIIGEIAISIFKVLSWVWWIILPIWLIDIAWNLWMHFVHVRYLKKVNYKLLELKVPKEVFKTPKSMENIFSTFHATRAFIGTWKKKYVEGAVQLWLSLEIVGSGGGISFYIRTPKEFQNLIESQIYAQYPDVEITEEEDYVNFLPAELPNKHYDVWGADFELAKPSAYPIRTYEYFEEHKDEKRIDPLSSIMETMSKLKGEERIWFQILIKYTDSKWKEESDSLVNKLIGKKEAKKDISLSDFSKQFTKNLGRAVFKEPEWNFGGDNKDAGTTQMVHMTAGEKDVVSDIQKKASKLGYETSIRFLYIDKKETFSRQNINSFMGSFQQFNTQNMNSFKPNSGSLPGGKPPFKKQKEFLKKRMLYAMYRLRLMNPGIKSILNIEELATIYHFPIITVEAPFLKRIQSKRGEPPVNLPLADS